MGTIKELMNTEPHWINDDSSLTEAAKKMLEYDCGSLIVGTDQPNGIITDRDIVLWGIAANKDVNTTKVKEIMSREVKSCYEDQTLEEAADIMSDNDIRRLVVLQREDDRLVGVISLADIIKCPDSEHVNDEVIHHLFRYA
ncbi:MAG: CBS domain-containing protein [Rickettsiales bacterium]|nr:CBS domain-containing protein [Rickettsiales bacterium]